MTLKIQGTDLATIVGAVRAKDYDLKHGLTLDQGTLYSTNWRVFTKDDRDTGLQRVLYVSDACEMIARNTFDAQQTEAQERSALEDLLKSYHTASVKAEEVKQKYTNGTMYAAGAGALLGFFLARAPGAIVLGGLFALSWLGISGMRKAYEDRKLEHYLDDRNIKTGTRAFASL